jgi:hypothetical protein
LGDEKSTTLKDSPAKPEMSAASRCLSDVEDSFAEAIIHAGHKVFGFSLKPFSRWHAAQLDFIGSPLAGHAGKLNFTSLWIAVQICRTIFPQHINTSTPQPSSRVIALYGLGSSKSNRRLLFEQNKFSAYLRDYSGAPEFITEDESEPRTAKTPWYLFQVADLVRNGNLSRADAWNISLGEGNWWRAACAEANGAKIDILQPADRKQLQEIESGKQERRK